MIKQILLISVSLLLGGVCHGDQIDDERAMTVLITNNQMGGAAFGTGVLLDPTHVITCFHLAHSPKDDFMIFTYPLGRVVAAHIEGVQAANDLMILTLESSVTVKTAPVFENHFEIGEPITVVGNALGGMQWFVTKGIISGLSQGFLLTDALINPGNSGGPWFNASGQIVALTDWGIGPEPHIHGMAGGVSGAIVNNLLDIRAQQQIMRQLIGN